jgi:purine-binding chemotaxis protein CheW
MSSATFAETSAVRTDERAGKYLTFALGTEEYGIRVVQVREIMGLQDITPVPQTPAYVKGVINLRGKVIPVICLRAKFAMEQAEFTTRTCIIVVQVKGENGVLMLGLVVDGVSEVLNIGAAEIEDTPDFGSGRAMPYLLGMAKVRDRVKILLDIDQVMHAGEIAGLSSASRRAA